MMQNRPIQLIFVCVFLYRLNLTGNVKIMCEAASLVTSVVYACMFDKVDGRKLYVIGFK